MDYERIQEEVGRELGVDYEEELAPAEAVERAAGVHREVLARLGALGWVDGAWVVSERTPIVVWLKNGSPEEREFTRAKIIHMEWPQVYIET